MEIQSYQLPKSGGDLERKMSSCQRSIEAWGAKASVIKGILIFKAKIDLGVAFFLHHIAEMFPVISNGLIKIRINARLNSRF